MEYSGVDVEHPSVARGIKKMLKEGQPIENIIKVIGMPQEVIERYRNELKSAEGR